MIHGNAQAILAEVYTGDNGQYSFEGLIPGEYYVKYTYGIYDNQAKKTTISDKIVAPQEYKSTIINTEYTPFEKLINNFDTKEKDSNLWYWYQNEQYANMSSAVDNMADRDRENNNLKTITYDKQTNYLKYESDTYLTAHTGIMNFPIENYADEISDGKIITASPSYQLKFGIVERPRQSLKVNKEISNISLMLANGQVLAQGDPRNDSINYVSCLDGLVKIEVDNEIIQGATLDIEYEITVTNKSELDYNNVNYYRYGTGQNENDLVKIKIDSIVDYVDEKLSVTYDGGDFVYYNKDGQVQKNVWQIIQNPNLEQNKLAGIDIDPNVYKTIKTRTNIAVKNTDIEISPNESTSISLKANKLISNINNTDMNFDNYTELIKVSNSVGRFYGEMKPEWTIITPGNFNIKDITNTNEADNSNKAQLTIIPPTGEENIVIYSVIGIACLVMLIGGIILIKKFVLD